MTTEEAIKWMQEAKFGGEVIGDKDVVDACDMAIAALRAQQETENPKPLTLEELREMVDFSVYVVDLEAKQYPVQYWPAVVFEWRLEDPFALSFDYRKAVREITVVQPSAMAAYTRYFSEKTYGKEWLAYRHKPKEASN